MNRRVTFGEDLEFLVGHTQVVVLSDPSGRGKVAVSPSLQGRVLTSSLAGEGGTSFGWINRALLESGEPQPHIHAYGGEDRFWLGPEGGPFSLFFPPGAPFDLAHWQTPAAIDTMPYALTDAGPSSASFNAEFQVANYGGFSFLLRVDREVSIVPRQRAAVLLGVDIGDQVALIGFQSDNRITNLGDEAWTRKTGMVSVWILGMFTPSPRTTVVLPYREGDRGQLGPVVNDAYFGPVPADRLRDAGGVLYFRGDGGARGKIGISPHRVRPVLGSWDAAERVLTVVQFDVPPHAIDYVNSLWAHQDEPFSGDVVNSYNDGPPEPGVDPLGPFYELETSSPAAALMPDESLAHVHRTFHFQGPDEALDPVARGVLGVGLAEIEAALPSPPGA